MFRRGIGLMNSFIRKKQIQIWNLDGYKMAGKIFMNIIILYDNLKIANKNQMIKLQNIHKILNYDKRSQIANFQSIALQNYSSNIKLVIKSIIIRLLLSIRLIMQQARSYDCEVCFTNSQALNPHQKIIRCTLCKRKAHLYCYNPSLKQANFTCDGCLSKNKEICVICNNPGLLKKFPNGYAHPVCLFFHQAMIVADYKQLKFANAQILKPGKKLRCSQCHNTTGSVLRCSSKKCPLSCHLYCAMKSSHIIDGKGWRVCMQPLDDQKSLKDVIENLLMRTLRTQNKFIAGQLGIKKSLKTLGVPVMIYCEQHSLAIVQCFCRELNEQKLDWLYCESCCRWLHMACVQMTPEERQKIETSDFFCLECRAWQKWVKQRSPDVPKILPKLHLYDYVYINKELEELESLACFNLVQLAQRIPMLPGLVYGNMFYKQQLVKKLQSKVNYPALKNDLETKKYSAKAWFEHNDEMEIIKWIIKDSFIGSTQGQNSPHLLEESLEEQDRNQRMSILVEYEKKYYPNISNSLYNERKRKNIVKQQQKSERSRISSHPRTTFSSSSSGTSKGEIDAAQLREVIDFKSLNEYIQHFEQNYEVRHGTPIDYVQLFEEMFQIFRKPEIMTIMKDSPSNIWTRCLLLQTPRHAAVYASNIGKMESLKHKISYLREQDNKKKTPDSFKKLQQALQSWEQLKRSIYNIKEGISLKKFLLEEVNIMQIIGLIDKKLPAYQLEGNGLQSQQKDTNLCWMVNEKQLQRSLLQKEANLQGYIDVNMWTLKHVLLMLKRITFTKQSRQLVCSQDKKIQLQSNIALNLKHFLDQFQLLYQYVQSLIQELKISIPENNTTCYFQLLNNRMSSEYFLKNPFQLNSVITFLSKIKKLRLNIFSRPVQLTIVDLIRRLVEHFRLNPITQQQQLTAISYWTKILRIALPSQLQKVIRLDETIRKKYLFKQALFQLPEEIQKIKVELEQDLPKFQQLNLAFRVRQAKTILTWISLYDRIIQKIPVRSLLSLQIQNESQCRYPPKIEEIEILDQALTQIRFPEGQFREKFRQLKNIAKEMKMRFQNIMAACDWQFVYHHNPISSNKIDITQIEQFIEKSRKLPVCLGVETAECRIIIDRFNKNELKASILLKEIATKGNYRMNKDLCARVKQILNEIGANPIKSNYAEKMIQLMQKMNSPDQHQQKVQKAYGILTNSPQRFTYKEVVWMMSYFQTEYQGMLDKVKVLTNLRNYTVVIEECRSEYQEILQKYQARNNFATELQIKKVEFLMKKYKKSSIKDHKIATLCKDFTQYQELLSLYFHYENDYLPIEAKDLQELHAIIHSTNSLHPFFCDQKIRKLKQTFQELIKVKTSQM